MNSQDIASLQPRYGASRLENCLHAHQTQYPLKPCHSHRVFHRRDPLVSAGERFKGVYILRSGSAKSFITAQNGDEHITAFHFPGDLLAIDGFDRGTHQQNVRFLETSSVSFIKESEINSMMRQSDDFRRCLLESMSHALSRDSQIMMCLSVYNSEQRLARFLLDTAEAFAKRGLSGIEFELSMTRTDIANYLGMAIETVSRIIAVFQANKWIQVQHRDVLLCDKSALEALLQNKTASCLTSKSVAIGSVA